jgi:glycosyltransferase involved in cell wall biosynthesis
VFSPLKLAVLCDLLEERWFSMDLLGDMLLAEAARLPGVDARRVRPRLPRTLARWAEAHGTRPLERWAYRAAIGFGRYVEYPLAALGARGRHDFFHVTDHSYGHLALELPAERTGIYCHDLDAYRPALERDPNPARRAVARVLLAGLERARVVFHSSLTVREQILAHGLLPPERLVHAQYGVAAEFQPEPRAEDAALLGRPPFVLHVGSLIPRKNPEFLLQVLLEVCRAEPELEVFQMGGSFDERQRSALAAAGVEHRFHQFPHMKRPELSAYLRATRAVLLPSFAEGFGLPVVEALACGAPVVVSDIPVLREVGGAGVVVRPTDDVGVWRDAVLDVARGGGPSRDERLRAAAPYSWAKHARIIVETYVRLAASR